jgi:hypothetical protein
MFEQVLEEPTAGGAMNAFVVYPEEVGPFPVVPYCMGAPGFLCARACSTSHRPSGTANGSSVCSSADWARRRTRPAMARR